MGDASSQIGGAADPAGPHAPFPPAGWARRQTSTNAAVALGCAIGSWVLFPLVPAIVAVILARNAEEEIAVSGGRVTGQGLATSARVIAWANIAVSVVVLAVVAGILLSLGRWL